mgnify:CR=1 FL=1
MERAFLSAGAARRELFREHGLARHAGPNPLSFQLPSPSLPLPQPLSLLQPQVRAPRCVSIMSRSVSIMSRSVSIMSRSVSIMSRSVSIVSPCIPLYVSHPLRSRTYRTASGRPRRRPARIPRPHRTASTRRRCSTCRTHTRSRAADRAAHRAAPRGPDVSAEGVSD